MYVLYVLPFGVINDDKNCLSVSIMQSSEENHNYCDNILTCKQRVL